jgi:hypothetical protein
MCCQLSLMQVEGAFTLQNLLSREECQRLVQMSNAMGYTEDAPVSLGRRVRQNENCGDIG